MQKQTQTQNQPKISFSLQNYRQVTYKWSQILYRYVSCSETQAQKNSLRLLWCKSFDKTKPQTNSTNHQCVIKSVDLESKRAILRKNMGAPCVLRIILPQCNCLHVQWIFGNILFSAFVSDPPLLCFVNRLQTDAWRLEWWDSGRWKCCCWFWKWCWGMR